MLNLKKITKLLFQIFPMVLVGCGSITGLPSHGGGKRLSIEQDLITKVIRNSIRDINFDEIKDKGVFLVVDGIDDMGSGTLSGGRYSLEAFFRGAYDTNNNWQGRQTSNGEVIVLNNGQTSSKNLLGSLGVNQTFLHPSEYYGSSGGSDLLYMKRIIEQELRLKGINIKNSMFFTEEQSQEKADYIELMVMCDVLGLTRQRNDIIVSNSESYKISSVIRAAAFSSRLASDTTSKIIMPLRSSGYEALYKENYMFWAGPINIERKIEKINTEELLLR